MGLETRKGRVEVIAFDRKLNPVPFRPRARYLSTSFFACMDQRGEEEGERVRCLKREESSSNSFASAAATTATLQERGGTEKEH